MLYTIYLSIYLSLYFIYYPFIYLYIELILIYHIVSLSLFLSFYLISMITLHIISLSIIINLAHYISPRFQDQEQRLKWESLGNDQEPAHFKRTTLPVCEENFSHGGEFHSCPASLHTNTHTQTHTLRLSCRLGLTHTLTHTHTHTDTHSGLSAGTGTHLQQHRGEEAAHGRHRQHVHGDPGHVLPAHPRRVLVPEAGGGPELRAAGGCNDRCVCVCVRARARVLRWVTGVEKVISLWSVSVYSGDETLTGSGAAHTQQLEMLHLHVMQPILNMCSVITVQTNPQLGERPACLSTGFCGQIPVLMRIIIMSEALVEVSGQIWAVVW